MSDLLPEDRALIDAGARDDLPTDADRERVRARVALRIGAAVVGGGAATLPAKVAAAAVPNAATKIIVALAIVGLGAVVASVASFHPAAPPNAKTAAPSASAATLNSPPHALPEETPARLQTEASVPETVIEAIGVDALPSAARPSAARALPSGAGLVPPTRAEAAAKGPRDALAEETRILREANAATLRGEAETALPLLAEHARRFPSGVLAEERDAERVLALCASGRVGDAHAAAWRFLTDWPRSPLAGRVRSSCRAAP